jgi:hypothetical protein
MQSTQDRRETCPERRYICFPRCFQVFRGNYADNAGLIRTAAFWSKMKPYAMVFGAQATLFVTTGGSKTALREQIMEVCGAKMVTLILLRLVPTVI